MKLSFDILGYVFNYYAEEETIYYPIETLLLVCQEWRDAALGHRALWSHLNVHISLEGKHSSIRIWKKRLPLRLERAGDAVPLHVDLRHLPIAFADGSWGPEYSQDRHRLQRQADCPSRGNPNRQNPCACVRDALVCIDEFMLVLGGKDGELCNRWKTLHLELRNPAFFGVKYKQLWAILRRPLPTLTSLTIYGFDHETEELNFPHTPLLRRLTLVKELWYPTYSIPGEASNIEELVLTGSFRLPHSMPKLWRLDVEGVIHWFGGKGTELPNLTHLVIHNHWPYGLEMLVEGRGTDLSRLVSFGVHTPWHQRGANTTLERHVLGILKAATSLSIIHGNSKGISMILKLVWESEIQWKEAKSKVGKESRDEVRLLTGQRISIRAEHGSMVFTGDETCEDLCDAAVELKVDLPNVSWS